MGFLKNTILICTVLLATTHFSIASAEEAASQPDPNDQSLQKSYGEERFLWGDGTVTSVAKRPQSIEEVANTVSIITREDIVATGATTIPDIFAFVPGLQLFYRTANEPEVIIRGMPKQYSPRILVLVDGVTIYTPYTSGEFWYSIPVTVDSIERIEVIRGPASVVYGANAFSGVINIITRDPESFHGVEAKAYAGNLGNYGASATTMYNAGSKGHFRFSGEYFQSNGFGGNNGNEQDDGNKTGTVMADGFININENSTLRLGTWYRRANVDLPPNNIAPPALVGVDNIYALAQFNLKIPGGHQFRVYQFFNRENNFNRGDTLAIIQSDLMKYDIQIEDTWNWKDRNYLMLGTNYRYNGLKNSPLITNSLNNFIDLNMASVYLNDEFKVNDKIILTGGARYDYDTFTNSNWSARFNVSWLPHPDHMLRSSIARGVRSINYFEEKEDVTFPLSPDVIVEARGNPNLQPEEIVSAEFGYLGNFLNRRLRYNFDFFFNDVDNLILPTATPTPPNILSITVEDLGGTQLVGFETGIKYRIYDWWDFTFDYSFLHQNNDISGKGPGSIINVGNRFTTNFGFSANILFNWTDKSTIFDVGAITRRNIGDLYRLDVRLGQKFLHDQLEFAAVGQGLINYPRVEFEDTLQTDRRIFGTLIYRHK